MTSSFSNRERCDGDLRAGETGVSCVRWYVAYPLSLRHLEEMMAERGISVNHLTVHRWAIKLLPVLEKAFWRHKCPVGKSWRVDEAYIKVKGQWKYLYRAVDKAGNTVDFLLRANRDKAAARRYFERSIAKNGEPETVTIDNSGANLGSWRVTLGDTRHHGHTRHVHARFVFIGAGGGSLPLLQASGIPEAKAYGGFPVGGSFLVTERSEITCRHFAKVYGKASVGSPPMSVPHLDTRILDGKKALLFGPAVRPFCDVLDEIPQERLVQ